MTRRRARRGTQLLDDLKQKTGYWKFEEAALDRTLWGCGELALGIKSKVKVKCTLVQALRLCTGRTAHRGSRGIALL